jgi:hypothetical protein
MFLHYDFLRAQYVAQIYQIVGMSLPFELLRICPLEPQKIDHDGPRAEIVSREWSDVLSTLILVFLAYLGFSI